MSWTKSLKRSEDSLLVTSSVLIGAALVGSLRVRLGRDWAVFYTNALWDCFEDAIPFYWLLQSFAGKWVKFVPHSGPVKKQFEATRPNL